MVKLDKRSSRGERVKRTESCEESVKRSVTKNVKSVLENALELLIRAQIVLECVQNQVYTGGYQ